MNKMNSLAPSPHTNINQSHRQELQPPPIQPIEILLDKRQRHPHRQLQFRNQYNNDNNDIEIVRLLLKHGIIKDNLYNERLNEYFTIQEYTTRIKKFNSTSLKLQFCNIMIPLILSIIFLTILFVLVKPFTNKIIYGAALLIAITLAFFDYWFFIRNGKLKTKYLNKLLRKYNKEDVSKNIYWKIIKTDHNRTTQFYLTIELSELKPSPIYEEKNIPVIVDIHSNEDNMNKVVDNNINAYNVTNVDSMDNVDNLNNVNSVDNLNNVNTVNNFDNNNRLDIKDANNNNNNNDNYNYNDDNDNYNDDNYNDDSYNNYRHQSNLTIDSTRVSVDNAQIHTAIRTRPYELNPPTYYKITGFKRNKVNKVNEVNNDDDDCGFYEFYE
ncbi:hypothetical protein Glove_353g19 [Diversispora epigaea]|uniref:Uncharacterized protein n=1 Tax=Diversispora epigaea TaxID=1348612 RepID=A0A397HFQ6_9GLOM|nr:hypothetical protein Glove_353g19 [Diversispora epigaea]